MKTSKTLFASLIMTSLILAACRPTADVEQPEANAPPPPPPTFLLEGVVVEAAGSATVDVQKRVTTSTVTSPSPTRVSSGATGTATPTTTPTTTPNTTTTSRSTTRNRVLDVGAPGSIAVRLSTAVQATDDCVFSEGDTMVVMFTYMTRFDPMSSTESNNFPNNLDGATLEIGGRVIDTDECVFVADVVTVK